MEGEIIMTDENFEFAKSSAIKTAKQLAYSDEVISRLENAKSENEISRILVTARENCMFK